MLTISVAIVLALVGVAFVYLRLQQSASVVVPATDSDSSQQLNSQELLEFDVEINKILNNPNLSDTEKERLSNEFAEKYLKMTECSAPH